MQEKLVNEYGEFDLAAATGWAVRRLPLTTRRFGEGDQAVETDDGRIHCNTAVTIFYGDTSVDPRSGGVIGSAGTIAEALGLSERQVRRYGDSNLAFVHNVGGVYASAQASLQNYKDRIHFTLVSEEHSKAGIIGATARWKK